MIPAPAVADLLVDVDDEHAQLLSLVEALEAGRWDDPTPAPGWAVRDQVSHLAFFDEVAAVALTSPERFAPVADGARRAMESGEDPMAGHLARGRAMTGVELCRWWRHAHQALLEAARGSAPDARVPWFGPPMSLRSFLSARIMETWAHGQDVVDAVGGTRTPTDRLVHVAQIGVRARAFSFAVHGIVDDRPVRVELAAPSGARWSWDDDATDVVRGTALDFCLVVTQRRHLDDTDLEVTGDTARRWMAVAQAFAGPPGPGRPPLTS